jgi:hypothetical protein
MDPLISLRIHQHALVLHPEDELSCEYQIDAVSPSSIQAVEASVMWYTEGKGDEDFAVHYFERYTPSDTIDGDLRQLHYLRTKLPPSPLSYDGKIVKIRWCVRVRLYWDHGREMHVDRVFRLVPRSAVSVSSNGLAQALASL